MSGEERGGVGWRRSEERGGVGRSGERGGVGRSGEERGGVGRSEERGGVGRRGEEWGGEGRSGEEWGGVGRSGEEREGRTFPVGLVQQSVEVDGDTSQQHVCLQLEVVEDSEVQAAVGGDQAETQGKCC